MYIIVHDGDAQVQLHGQTECRRRVRGHEEGRPPAGTVPVYTYLKYLAVLSRAFSATTVLRHTAVVCGAVIHIGWMSRVETCEESMYIYAENSSRPRDRFCWSYMRIALSPPCSRVRYGRIVTF